LEAIKRTTTSLDVVAYVTGFEYSLYGINESGHDIGIITELHQDSRDNTPMQNDLFIGARYVLNDAESTEIIAGGMFDLEHESRAFSMELSRRLNDRWSLDIEARIFDIGSNQDAMILFDDDDYAQINLSYYF